MGRIMAASLVLVLTLVGCMKPYPTPEYVEIGPSQTAFTVSLEAGLDEQAKVEGEKQMGPELNSIEGYRYHQVTEKRIQIPKRWRQTGWRERTGEWIPTIQAHVAGRAPQARHWTMGSDTGTAAANQGFRLQSKDGVRFTVDFDCTANIDEADAARFMYHFPASKENPEDQNATKLISLLANIMDQQIWTMVQISACEFAAERPMEELKKSKAELNTYVREKVTAFFKERGITISTLGVSGDFSYADEKVQKAIDDIFINQQQLDVERATLASMDNKIARMTAEGISAANRIYQGAIGEAEAIRNIASGQAAEILNRAEGEALAINAVAQACLEAEGNPLFLPTKRLQVELARIKKWQGATEQIVLGGDNGAPLSIMNIEEMLRIPRTVGRVDAAENIVATPAEVVAATTTP